MRILELIIILIVLESTNGIKSTHLDELLNQEKKRKVVKRFDDLQYDPANVIETVVPVENHHNGYNFVTVKSNIPEEPSSTNQYDEEPANEIPVGPVVQAEETQQSDKGNVQLKDLLSFIRKTNIPENPYATTAERSQIFSPQDYYNSELRSRNPLISMDSMNTRTLAPQNDGIYQSKRFQFPRFARNQYPYINRWNPQSLQYKMNVKKAEIPKAPTPFIKETFDDIFPNAEKGDKKSGVVREDDDPYENLKNKIKKKDQVQRYLVTTVQADAKPASETQKPHVTFTVPKDTQPEQSIANGQPILNSKYSTLEAKSYEDPYETLKNAIKEKASSIDNVQNTTSKRANIPKSKYLMQYTEIPVNDGDEDAEKEAAAAFIQKMDVDYMKNMNAVAKKKNEIPGITIEHKLPTDSFPLMLHTIPAMVRKDMVPETKGGNYQVVQDANNENVYKKSDIPTTDDNQQANSDNTATTGDITSDMMENIEKLNEDNNAEKEDEKEQVTASQKSNLPTAEELEAVKMDREMKLADELNKMKKSTIPAYEKKQNIPVYTSYALQLRKYPAEGILRQEIPKRQNLLNYNINKTMPMFPEIIKRFEIPQESPPQSEMFTSIPNGQEFQKQDGTLPDINALMQSSLMDRIQENEHREEQIQQQEQQQERNLWQQQKEEIASRMRNEKNLDQDYTPFMNTNMEVDKPNEMERMAQMSQSPIESFRQFVQSSQEPNNMNEKRSQIPKPEKSDDVPSKDSFPLILRKWPPNRRRSLNE